VKFLADMGVSPLTALSEYKAVLMSGAILTIEDGRYRLRRLPIQPIETSLED